MGGEVEAGFAERLAQGEVCGYDGAPLPQELQQRLVRECQRLALAQQQLADDGIAARVVSMPCVEWFDRQPAAYRDSVLPPSVTARVSVEAGISQGWWKYLGSRPRCR